MPVPGHPPITGPLASVLKEGRERFNARFDLARKLNSRLEPTSFAQHLQTTLDPVARAVAATDPERLGPAVEALFDLSLELFARDCLGPGSRSPMVGEVWVHLLPRAASQLAEDPRRVAAALSNAAHNLSVQPGARPEEWLEIMEKLAPISPSADVYLKAGQVAAWRCGMAHYRKGALSLLPELPEEALRVALSLSAGIRSSIEEIQSALEDPWASPEKAETPRGAGRLSIVGRVGGFRGFGGPFITPPEVFSLEGQLYAFDAECCWSVHADCFGATFQRYGPDIPKGELGQGDLFSVGSGGIIRNGTITASFPVFAMVRSWASDGTTLALTLERSHNVYLVAVVRG